MAPLLVRKEVCDLFRIDRSTLHRWCRMGLPVVAGRWFQQGEILLWLEQKDAAKTLGIDLVHFLRQTREVRELLLAAAMKSREAAASAVPQNATLCHNTPGPLP